MTFTNETLDFASLSDVEVQDRLKQYNLVLTVDEARTIQESILKRPPTVAECVLWSIEGSEHCSYKSSRQHLKGFTTDGPNVIIGAKEDAGIIALATDNADHRYGLVISHESHNHPSQIVPFEGAATGVGGNVRDVCCMGAQVIAVADSLRFGDLTTNKTRWIHEGVVAGIASYGNSLGIPNIGGDLYYDAGYNENCLVTIVTLGIVREDAITHSYAPKEAAGYDLILVGKPTDNSGFGGASFASLELEAGKEEQNRGAVQEPNAFLERHLLKATYALCQRLKADNLIDRVGFKDLGAGGVACASVELADSAGLGAEITLDAVHTSMPNLHPSVILCSETQERFMWVSPPDVTPMILEHYNKVFDLPHVSAGAQASVIGKIRSDDQYIVKYQGQDIVNAKAGDVTEGIVYSREVQVPTRTFSEPSLPTPSDFNQTFLALLAHENIASRQAVFENYDKQVQGRTVMESGVADSGVIQPFNSDEYPEEIRQIGVALSTDHNPRYNQIDPYWGAVNAVVEAIRNVAATGAVPQAITDCLCYGNPEKPEQMWEFVEGVRGIKDACETITLKEYPDAPLPIVAGNVSFYNESQKGAIPASPMISCVGKLNDINKAITYAFKQTDSILLMVGDRRDECGGSVYYALSHVLGANVPKPDCAQVAKEVYALTDAIDEDLVLAAHDVSDGGIAIALAEMSLHSGIGFSVEIPGNFSKETRLFTETGGFVLEIAKANLHAVIQLFQQAGITPREIGVTTTDPRMRFFNEIDVSIEQAKTAWLNGLRDRLA